MAVVLRCSCILPRPNSGRFSGLTEKFSPETPLSGRLESLPLKMKKFISSSGNSSNIQLEANEALVGSQPVHLELDNINFSKLQCTSAVAQIRPDNDTILEHSAVHQDMMLIRSTPMAFIVTNALMLATPLEALAQTCEADNSAFEMPLLLLVAIVGATVGGLLARQRKGEMKRLNEQLRQINAALRRQAKIESYAPNLSYAPVGSRIVDDTEVIVDLRKHELISHLKNGKNFLRNQDPEKAYLEFEMALELAQTLKDPIEEKKAARGLGASLQRQSKFKEAIKYHLMVPAISEREGEDSGNTEAYGAIADCYTELGDLERAGVYYDQYIARLQSD